MPLAVLTGLAIALTLSWSSESLHGIFNPSAALLLLAARLPLLVDRRR